MPLLYEATSDDPVMSLLARGGVPDEWIHPSDLMVVVRTVEHAVRVDFVGVATLLLTPWHFVSDQVAGFVSGEGGVWEHEDRDLIGFSIGRGTGDYQGMDGAAGLRSFSWAFPQNSVLRVAAEDVEFREFQCPILRGDAEADRHRLWKTAFELKAFRSDLVR